MSKEKTIESIRNLAIEIRENNDKELWVERFIHAIYQEVVYPLIEEHNDKVANLYAKIEPLEKKNKVLERALELACKGVELKYAKPFGNKADYRHYFIQQAEEELKNE